MIYEFEVPGKVIGKGRPRLNSYTGVVYTPTRTKDYESLVEQYFLLKYPRFKILEGRITYDTNHLHFSSVSADPVSGRQLYLSHQRRKENVGGSPVRPR